MPQFNHTVHEIKQYAIKGTIPAPLTSDPRSKHGLHVTFNSNSPLLLPHSSTMVSHSNSPLQFVPIAQKSVIPYALPCLRPLIP